MCASSFRRWNVFHCDELSMQQFIAQTTHNHTWCGVHKLSARTFRLTEFSVTSVTPATVTFIISAKTANEGRAILWFCKKQICRPKFYYYLNQPNRGAPILYAKLLLKENLALRRIDCALQRLPWHFQLTIRKRQQGDQNGQSIKLSLLYDSLLRTAMQKTDL